MRRPLADGHPLRTDGPLVRADGVEQAVPRQSCTKRTWVSRGCCICLCNFRKKVFYPWTEPRRSVPLEHIIIRHASHIVRDALRPFSHARLLRAPAIPMRSATATTPTPTTFIPMHRRLHHLPAYLAVMIANALPVYGAITGRLLFFQVLYLYWVRMRPAHLLRRHPRGLRPRQIYPRG